MTGKESAKILAAHATMQKFLKQENVQEALKEGNFEKLYLIAYEDDFSFIGDMHWLFESVDANPLEYLGDFLPAKYFYGDSCLKTFQVPGKFTTIGTSCFAGAENLTAVELEEGVQNMGPAVFSGCIHLNHVVLPASLVSPIFSFTFRNCTRLKEVVYRGDVLTAKNDVFARSDVFAESAVTKVSCKDGFLEIKDNKIVNVVKY